MVTSLRKQCILTTIKYRVLRCSVTETCAVLGYYAASSVILYRRFWATYRSHQKGSQRPLKMGPIGCPETSVKIYHSTLRNIPEQLRSHQHRRECLNSQIVLAMFRTDTVHSPPGSVSLLECGFTRD